MSTTKLSQYQKRILQWVLEQTEWYETNGNEFLRGEVAHWGVSWHDGVRRTNAENASLSRSLCRLEERGLVQRRNHVSGDPHGTIGWDGHERHTRTTHVRLTKVGREVAKRLTNNQGNMLTVS